MSELKLKPPALLGDVLRFDAEPIALSFPGGNTIMIMPGHEAVVEEFDTVTLPELRLDELWPVVYIRVAGKAFRYKIPPSDWRKWRGLKR